MRDVSQLTGRRIPLSICTRATRTLQNRVNYRDLKLIEQVMNVLERVVESLIRKRVEIDEMQCGFMSGRGTNDALFIQYSYRRST